MKTLLLALLITGVAPAQDGGFAYPPILPGARIEAYKTIGNTTLNLYIFEPAKTTSPLPAIVFFFGGGWTHGSPAQFEQHCRRLASLGMVAITADYRVETRNQSTVPDSIRDAKSAMRYVRRHAARLGIDPARIAAGGGSAGGMLAAVTALVPGYEETGEEATVTPRPAALVLFNPALILGPVPGDESLTAWSASRISRPIFGRADGASISPWHHIANGAPPTLILHGKADTTVPYASAVSFAAKMKNVGARCDLIGYDGQKHGFFNYKAGGTDAFRDTLREAEVFLASLGYLSAR